MLPSRVAAFFHVPLLRRVAFHARRISNQVDRHFFFSLLTAVLAFVAVATVLVGAFESKLTLGGLGNTLHWAVTTVIGSGDASYVTTPGVRTVVEANNPAHVDHFRRAKADEVLVTSRLASRLLARSALYPGLSELVTDLVSGGAGSELYRISIPEEMCGLSVDDFSARLRADHNATLLAVSRQGHVSTNPATDFKMQPGDDAVVVAESLGTLAPLRLAHD
jgi:hypothetical protein